MNSSNILLSGSEYFMLNKVLMKKIGINATLILSELINYETANKGIGYFRINLNQISENTTLSIFKIKNSINKLYKKKIIDAVVKNNEIVDIKIEHTKILNIITSTMKKDSEMLSNKKKTAIKHTRFKKPLLEELRNYFLEIGELDESEIMFDYYESKGWKVGRSPMKCWKSAARNWIRRLNKKTKFPDFYDKKLELSLGNDVEKVSKYHNHLRQLGWTSTYSPSSGITWKKKTK